MHRHVNANENAWCALRVYFHFSSILFCCWRLVDSDTPRRFWMIRLVLIHLPRFAYSHLFVLNRSDDCRYSAESHANLKPLLLIFFWVKCIRNLFQFNWRKIKLTHAQMKEIGLFEFTVPDQATSRFTMNLSACVCPSFGWIQGSPIFRKESATKRNTMKFKLIVCDVWHQC